MPPDATRAAPSLRDALRDALAAADALPDAAGYARLRAGALARGAALERELLARVVDERTWNRTLAALGGDRVRDQYHAVMGYGELMTRFLVAPVPLDDDARRAVAVGGAFANLLVGAFDELVDAGAARARLLPERPLRRAALDGALWPLRVSALAARAGAARLVRALARDYFARAARHAGRAVLVERRAFLGRAVLEMYDADGRSAAEWARRADAARARRKTEHPLVVLGYPAWLAVPGHEEAHRRHRRWLRRVGRYVRWVDDAADASLDAAAGHGNLALQALRACDATGAERLARALVARHQRVMREWHATAPAAARAGDEALALGAVVTAWLGAPEPVVTSPASA